MEGGKKRRKKGGRRDREHEKEREGEGKKEGEIGKWKKGMEEGRRMREKNVG